VFTFFVFNFSVRNSAFESKDARHYDVNDGPVRIGMICMTGAALYL
jgi:hypothetical protein